MPELPEVETIVRDLRSLIVGRKIESVRVRLNKIVRTGPRRLTGFLKGAEVLATRRRGKFIVIELSSERYVVVHLKMTGQFLWGPAPRQWPKHVHLTIGFEENRTLMYRDMRQFGYFQGLDARAYTDWLNETQVGPDPFQITPDEFARRLSGRRGRIKPLLLDQRFLSGMGNIYTDEALFATGIHPLCPADQIEPEAACRLHEEICSILQEAIRLRGSTTRDYVGLKGVGGKYQGRHQVYGMAGKSCPKCGCSLERIVVGGRGTHLCPQCQSKP